MFFFFVIKQKTAYDLRISDWSSDVCSSGLNAVEGCAGVLVNTVHRQESYCLSWSPSAHIHSNSKKKEKKTTRRLSLTTNSSAKLQNGRASCRERVCQYV